MASTGFTDIDIQVTSSSFIATGLLYEYTHGYLEKNLPKWDCFPQTLRNRMCIEIACIPVRIGLIYFSLPSVLLAFTPASNWTADDTQRSLIACSLMTGAYLFDLMIYREDFFGILHHCMGPALLLWTRLCFSSFTSADALVSRSLMMFIFFGAATGGVFASAGVFLLRVGKRYLERSSLYKYFALCVAGLTVTTVLSCYLNVLYFLHTWDAAYGYFGLAAPLPIIWETFECYLQWRWLLRFYSIEAKLCRGDQRPKDYSDMSDSTPDEGTVWHEIPSAFPKETAFILRALVWQWVVLLLCLYFKFAKELYLHWSFSPTHSVTRTEEVIQNITKW
ncbi:uncharacterized protein TRIVIDRAFT_59887 [Trichoderma virens Gv29-8]|uniref:TLC domain-containing protein n=1 Tax=Hypocrea virens (strain Gv29-8 / FGSC 10586) TaxID=413071 RepID=G9MV64_HYPVG|nr:uncharacterized protein TRIVIDRAFT_59887 [Trichoderma virens Gv29-8]EHK21650.1 hypothetical protein TRIVIDRAFT_59887 [Trichoderma virens Gv29-8]